MDCRVETLEFETVGEVNISQVLLDDVDLANEHSLDRICRNLPRMFVRTVLLSQSSDCSHFWYSSC